MEYTEETHGRVTVLIARGKLDSEASASFGERLQRLAATPEVRLLIDMAKVTFIASAGLRSITIGLKAVQASNGALALCEVQRPVREVLDVTGYSTLVRVFPKRAIALGILGAS